MLQNQIKLALGDTVTEDNDPVWQLFVVLLVLLKAFNHHLADVLNHLKMDEDKNPNQH